MLSESRNACAVPWNEPLSACGSPISACALLIAFTASPSEAPGLRLNEIVTAGNWPWWLMDRYAVLFVSTLTKVDNGTCWPVVGDVRYSLSNRLGSCCILGVTSSTTW